MNFKKYIIFSLILLIPTQSIIYGYSSDFKSIITDTISAPVTINGNTFNIFYSDHSTTRGKDRLDASIRELNNLFNFLKLNQELNTTIKLEGKSLSEITLSTQRDIKKYKGYDHNFFFSKYAPEFYPVDFGNSFTNADADLIATSFIENILKSFSNISENTTTLEDLSSSLSDEISLFFNPLTTGSSISSEDLSFVKQIINLEIKNKTRSHILKFYKDLSANLGDKRDFLSFDIDDYESEGDITKSTLLTKRNELLAHINLEYSDEVVDNINNNILGVNSEIDDFISGTDKVFEDNYNIFNSEQISTLTQQVETRYLDFLDTIDSYILYLDNLKTLKETISTSSGGVTNSGGVLYFNYELEGVEFSLDGNSSGFSDYTPIEKTNEVLSISDFFNQDSKEIVNFLNTTSSDSGTNPLSNYAYTLANNIDRNEDFFIYSNGVPSLISYINQGVSFDGILKNEVKPHYLSISQSGALKESVTSSITQADIELFSGQFLLEQSLSNFGKTLLNNQTLTKNTILPYSSIVHNENTYKDFLSNSENSNYQSIDKQLLTSTNARDTEEGITNISFSFTPSSQPIIESGNTLGVSLGLTDFYYLNRDNSNFELPLDSDSNYKISLRSYNGVTPNLSLFTIDNNGIQNPIVLRGERRTVTTGRIQTKIIQEKNDVTTINSLFVNDLLKK